METTAAQSTRETMGHETPGALNGVRVLDLTHHVAGPYCTKLLADFGAEVVKIERPGVGDDARRFGPFAGDDPHPEKSLLFAYLNTSKKSVTLDLKSPTGRRIFQELLSESHILIESFSPRVMPTLGLGFDRLAESRPGLVMVSISNFGQTGPYRDYKATDMIEYALGGLMYILGSYDRPPLKHAFRQAQFKAGTNAASAALIAFTHVQMTGEGQWVDVSIQESIASGLRDTTSLYTFSGAIRQREHPYTGEMPHSALPTKDGHAVPLHYGGVDWESAADFLGAPMLKEERFSTHQGRLDNARELQDILIEAFQTWNKYELFYEAHKRKGHIYGVVQAPNEVVESPQYVARGYFSEVDHPEIGRAAYPGAPFAMSRTPWRAHAPAPGLGQHNEEIYCERLGYTSEELRRLSASGTV